MLGLTHAVPAVLVAAVVPAVAGTNGTAEGLAERRRSDFSHEFAGGASLGFAQAREDLILPLRFVGPGFGVGMRYTLATPNWELRSSMNATALVLFDRYDTPNGVVEPAVELAWRRRLHNPVWLTNLNVGPVIGAREFLGYYGSWDDSHLYWLGMSQIGVSASGDFALGGRSIRIELAVPLCALVTRPPRYRRRKIDNVTSVGYWLGRFVDSPEMTSWHQLQALDLRATWRQLGDGWALDPYVRIDFVSFADPRRVTYLNMWLGLEVRW